MRTKIVCTLGPSTDDYAVLRSMVEAGMSVARLNFSHDTHENHKRRIDMVKKLRAETGLPISLMLDTKGPEIRVKKFKNGKIMLKNGQKFILDCSDGDVLGDNERVAITFSRLVRHLKEGDTALLNDGNIELRVDGLTKTEIICTVIEGGELGDNKSINLPNNHIDMPYLSERDRADIIFGIENDVDYIAASFVRSANDVKILKNLLDSNGAEDVEIIAKIENRSGVNNIAEIINECCGIMVARGDMGVEIPFEELPAIQKDIIRRCNRAGKFAITATQMLESMVLKHRPTRAEISDVANAVLDGTGATMLSGETAMGRFPVEAVRTMAKIAAETEKAQKMMLKFEDYEFLGGTINTAERVADAVCHAACMAARDLKCSAIAAITASGCTAQRISGFRIHSPCIALTVNEKVYHKLAMYWGVKPMRAAMQQDSDSLIAHSIELALDSGLVRKGDLIAIVAGIPVGEGGKTNLLKIERV